jgi:hypothetical protein
MSGSSATFRFSRIAIAFLAFANRFEPSSSKKDSHFSTIMVVYTNIEPNPLLVKAWTSESREGVLADASSSG